MCDLTPSANGRTFVSASRRSTFKGSQTLQKNRKSTKISDKSLRRCFANAQREENEFSAPGRDLASILIVSACSGALQGVLSDVPVRSWRPSRHSRGAPRTLRDAPKTLPRRLRDALGRVGVSERVPGAILYRFWVPRGVSGYRFSIAFCDDFRFILRASWPANGITLDG